MYMRIIASASSLTAVSHGPPPAPWPSRAAVRGPWPVVSVSCLRVATGALRAAASLPFQAAVQPPGLHLSLTVPDDRRPIGRARVLIILPSPHQSHHRAASIPALQRRRCAIRSPCPRHNPPTPTSPCTAVQPPLMTPPSPPPTTSAPICRPCPPSIETPYPTELLRCFRP
jgi:hypothetical protein